jgi:hypothetical protein
MPQDLKRLPAGIQTFKKIIETNRLYVDKTRYIENIIANDAQFCFLSRPNRFGKSLTLSTLEAVFSGDRTLFKGLDIEPRLGEALFAPRPVIRLDMLKAATSGGQISVNKALASMTARAADDLGVEVPRDEAASAIFEQLITGLARKTGQRVAVLIDDYDRPLMDFLLKPDEMKQARRTLAGYYSQLKAADEHISFVFITGMGKFSSLSPFSVLDSSSDISIDPEYGAICGFTHEELMRDFGPYLEAAAESLKMGQEELVERMRSCYGGFCFDGETMVYNPASALQFFISRVFYNFWFESGSSFLLTQYMRDRRLTVEQFRGLEISRRFARYPGELDQTSPEGFLYQTGYLSLRPGRYPDSFTLDYPNQEVYGTISRYWLQDCFGTLEEAEMAIGDLRSAFATGDAGAVIEQFNAFLVRLPSDDRAAAANQPSGGAAPGANSQPWFYRSALLSLMMVAGLDAEGEIHGIPYRTDLVVRTAEKVWVLEFKVFNEAGGDQETAEAALAQILENGYARQYGEYAIAVGIAINDAERAISAWRVLGDEPAPGPKASSKPEASAKYEMVMKP